MRNIEPIELTGAMRLDTRRVYQRIKRRRIRRFIYPAGLIAIGFAVGFGVVSAL